MKTISITFVTTKTKMSTQQKGKWFESERSARSDRSRSSSGEGRPRKGGWGGTRGRGGLKGRSNRVEKEKVEKSKTFENNEKDFPVLVPVKEEVLSKKSVWDKKNDAIRSCEVKKVEPLPEKLRFTQSQPDFNFAPDKFVDKWEDADDEFMSEEEEDFDFDSKDEERY